jgi:hypothetical protein
MQSLEKNFNHTTQGFFLLWLDSKTLIEISKWVLPYRVFLGIVKKIHFNI